VSIGVTSSAWISGQRAPAPQHDEDRFNRIRDALERNAALPPSRSISSASVTTCSTASRVAAALLNGQVEMDANVVEYVRSPTSKQPSGSRRAGRSERATGLTEIGAARPDSYRILLDAIEHYCNQQALDDLREQRHAGSLRSFIRCGKPSRRPGADRCLPG